jgi:phospholipase C
MTRLAVGPSTEQHVLPPLWCRGGVLALGDGSVDPAHLVQNVLDTLTSNLEIWAHTLFILHDDENGGFFDHVPPPVPPPGQAGRIPLHEPAASAGGIIGPVGLGFRVPCVPMSPFTTGGYTATEVFDHTSTLLLLEQLFGVTTPNVSEWRRSMVGDMTSALALGQPAQLVPPVLPDASLVVPVVDEEVVVNALTGTFDEGFSYAPPTANAMPVQETTPARPAPPQPR